MHLQRLQLKFPLYPCYYHGCQWRVLVRLLRLHASPRLSFHLRTEP